MDASALTALVRELNDASGASKTEVGAVVRSHHSLAGCHPGVGQDEDGRRRDGGAPEGGLARGRG